MQETQQASANPGAFDAQAWSAVIGDRGVEYYLPRFQTFEAGGRRPGWHWPAFLIAWVWMMRRRMRAASVLYVLSFLVVTPFIARGLRHLGLPGGAAFLAWWLLAALFSGLFATRWYYEHCRSVMSRARRQTRSQGEYLGYLRAEGGTRSLLPHAAVLLLAGLVAAVVLPVKWDMEKREEIRRALAAGEKAAGLAQEHQRRTGRLPRGLQELPQAPAKPAIATHMRLDEASGEVSLGFEALGVVRLLPGAGDARTRCSAPGFAKPQLLPAACRGDAAP